MRGRLRIEQASDLSMGQEGFLTGQPHLHRLSRAYETEQKVSLYNNYTMFLCTDFKLSHTIFKTDIYPLKQLQFNQDGIN